jgi:hypothetical protein
MNTCQVDGLVVQQPHTTPSAPGHPGHQTLQCVISSCGVSSKIMFTSHHFQRHYQNCESASTPQSGTSHKTCLRGSGGSGSLTWTSAVSHVGRTSNAFKVTMKLQTFLFQMVVTLCISVQYLWKYGFAKSYENLYAPCTLFPLAQVMLFPYHTSIISPCLTGLPSLSDCHPLTCRHFGISVAFWSISRSNQNLNLKYRLYLLLRILPILS